MFTSIQSGFRTHWIFYKKKEEQSLELFQVLTMSKHKSYRDIIIGDQSWFVNNYALQGQWVLDDKEAPSFPNSHNFTYKMMITFIWTYILDELPEGEHLNSKYFIEHNLKPLEDQEQQI